MMDYVEKVKELWKGATTKGFEAIQQKLVKDFLPKIRVEASRNTIVFMLHKEVMNNVDGKYRSLMSIPGIHDQGLAALKERYTALLNSEKVKKPGDLKDREKRVVATYIGALFAVLPPIKKDRIDFQAIVKRILQILGGLNITLLDLSNTPHSRKLAAAAMSPDMAIFLNFVIGAGEDTKYNMDEHKELFLALFENLDANGGMPEMNQRIVWMGLSLEILFSKVSMQPSPRMAKVLSILEDAKKLGKTMKVKSVKEAMQVLEGDMTSKAMASTEAILKFIQTADAPTLERELPMLIASLQEWDEYLNLRGKLLAFMIPVVREYIGTSITFESKVRTYNMEGNTATIQDDHGDRITAEHDWLCLH